MYVAFHYPFFGSSTVDAQQMRCPQCGANDWKERDIAVCNPGDEFECAKCGKKVWINWGLVEPDHLSGWLSSEYCPHRLCRIKYEQLRRPCWNWRQTSWLMHVNFWTNQKEFLELTEKPTDR